MLPC